jgi:hypothetical protein
MIYSESYLVPTRCVGMHQGRAASCKDAGITSYSPLLYKAQRAETAFPRSAWEREKI